MRLLGVLASLLALAGFAGAQSLEEAARKERERRAKLRATGSVAPAITEDQLAAGAGKAANDPQAQPANEPSAKPASEASSKPASEGSARPASEESSKPASDTGAKPASAKPATAAKPPPGAATATGDASKLPSSRPDAEAGAAPSSEAYWRARAAAARARVQDAQDRYDALDRMIRLGQPETYDENGKATMLSPQTMKRLADAAQADLAAARKTLEDLADEARREGAQPGWLRE